MSSVHSLTPLLNRGSCRFSGLCLTLAPKFPFQTAEGQHCWVLCLWLFPLDIQVNLDSVAGRISPFSFLMAKVISYKTDSEARTRWRVSPWLMWIYDEQLQYTAVVQNKPYTHSDWDCLSCLHLNMCGTICKLAHLSELLFNLLSMNMMIPMWQDCCNNYTM